MSIITIIITIVLIVFIYFLLRSVFSDPYTVSGILSAQTPTTINATSLATNGSSTPSSNFTYSIWFYINDWNYRYGETKAIFGRMGQTSTSSTGTSVEGLSGIDPCPAVILDQIENNLIIALGCFPGASEQPSNPNSQTVIHTCNVSNIPIQSWVNLTMSVYGRSLDVYIDGKLVKTCLLPGIAAINNNSNLYITPNGGFDGYTSKLQYIPSAYNPQQAWNIYTKGYSSSLLSTLFGAYQLQISLVENGSVQKTLTI